MTQLVTGEAVAVDLRVARLASRLTAALLDGAIQIAALLLVIFVFSAADLTLDPAIGVALLILIIIAIFLGYPVITETLWVGQTVGKKALGLRVVRDDGGPIQFRHALLRGLLGLFVEKFSPLFFVGVIASLASEQGKRLGDVVAGTFVLQERIPSRTPTVIPMPPSLAPWAATLDLSGLSGDLALAVREFLGRASGLTPVARDQLGRQLYSAVASVVTPPPPAGVPGGAYLAAVLAERRRREELRLRASSSEASGPASGWGGPPPAGTPSPWGSDGPAGTPSPWPSSAPSIGRPPVVGAPPVDPGPPPPQPAAEPGPFAPPS